MRSFLWSSRRDAMANRAFLLNYGVFAKPLERHWQARLFWPPRRTKGPDDEPTAALDPEITNQVVSIIYELSETGITQVVVTHEVDFAKKIASHVLYLEQGHMIEHGTKEAFTNPATPQFAEYLTH